MRGFVACFQDARPGGKTSLSHPYRSFDIGGNVSFNFLRAAFIEMRRGSGQSKMIVARKLRVVDFYTLLGAESMVDRIDKIETGFTELNPSTSVDHPWLN